jgi:hypothetical protein
MGRRSYSGEKRRKELMRKAKRDAKAERKQQEKGEGGAGSGPPIDWDAQVGGVPPPPDAQSDERDDAPEDGATPAR